MTILVLGLVIFLGLHSTRIVSESGRERAIARIGEGPWKGVYSLISAIGFVLIVWGFARARYDAPQLWTPPAGARHITMLLMLIALILLAGFLFKRSHIAVITHHPMLWSVLLWSVGHLFANGSAADLLLFGAFLIWSAADLASSYSRDRRNGIVYPTPELGATASSILSRNLPPRPALSSLVWSSMRCSSAGCTSGSSACRRWRCERTHADTLTARSCVAQAKH